MDRRGLDSVRKQKLIHVTAKGRKTGKPHTVELWFAVADDLVYLSHEGESTDWMKNIAADGRVSMEIGGLTFDGSAKITATGSSRERGKKALYEKYYGTAKQEVIDDWFSLSQVVEVTPIWTDP
jgi:deazaflavin-dependent oxidoreductase (nitroreductase family)